MATDEKDDKKDLVPDPDEEERDAREDFYSNMYRQPVAPAARPDMPLPPPPDVAAGGEVLPQVQIPGSDTLANRLRAREQTLTEELHPARKTGWGRVGQVLGTVGQDIGNALEPGVMAAIPGTTLNRRLELAGIRRELGEEQQREALRGEAAGRLGVEQQRAEIEARKAGLPTMRKEDRFTRTDPDTGRTFNAWEIPGQPDQWVPEGGYPTLPSTGGQPTGAIPGTMPSVQVPPPAPPTPPPPTATGPAPQGAPPTVAAPPAPGQPRWIYGKGTEAQRPLSDAERSQANADFADRWRVLNPNKPVPPEYQLGDHATQKDYDRVNESLKSTQAATGTAAQQEFNREQARERTSREAETARERKEKAAGEWVVAVDNDEKKHYVTRGDYDSRPRDFHPNPGNLPPGAYEKAVDHTTAINEMQARMNAAAESAQKFNFADRGQRSVMIQAMQKVEDSYADKVIGIPIMDFVATHLKELGLQGATPETREYVTDLIALREAMLAMPKEITGGSRMLEKAVEANWATLPSGVTPDLKYAMTQLQAVQSIIDRVHGTRVPIIDGIPQVGKIPDLYKYSGTNPQTKQRIYSDDKKNWFDEDGRPVRQ